jgi:hypothetical protein
MQPTRNTLLYDVMNTWYTSRGLRAILHEHRQEILSDCSGGYVVMSSSTPFNKTHGWKSSNNWRIVWLLSATYLKSSEDKASLWCGWLNWNNATVVKMPNWKFFRKSALPPPVMPHRRQFCYPGITKKFCYGPPINWPVVLTEVFPCFSLSCKANART